MDALFIPMNKSAFVYCTATRSITQHARKFEPPLGSPALSSDKLFENLQKLNSIYFRITEKTLEPPMDYSCISAEDYFNLNELLLKYM